MDSGQENNVCSHLDHDAGPTGVLRCWVARSNEVYYTLRCKHSTPAGRIRIRIRILMVLIWA